MKPSRLIRHAGDRAAQRGASASEVGKAVREGRPEPVRDGRVMYRLNLPYNALWQGKLYAIKQIAPIIVETDLELVVVTVLVFYF